ncbi:MAG: TlpA family protein disulfide reductase [Pyrinomonadaceae bacterium]
MSSNNKTERIRFWSPLRIVSTLVVLSLFAAFGISSCNSNDENGSKSVTTTVNPAATKAPASAPAALNELPQSVRNAELKAAAGDPIKLGDYSGKVLLINLWATWCGPCRQETPELVRLHKEFQSRGVEIVGLSTENPDASAESVRQFVKDFNVDYRIGWATTDVAIKLMQGRDAIPQSFVIGRDGRIVRRFIGFSSGGTPPQIRQALEDALKG